MDDPFDKIRIDRTKMERNPMGDQAVRCDNCPWMFRCPNSQLNTRLLCSACESRQ